MIAGKSSSSEKSMTDSFLSNQTQYELYTCMPSAGTVNVSGLKGLDSSEACADNDADVRIYVLLAQLS